MFLALSVAVVGRLVYMQVVKADEWSAAATAQRTRDIRITPRRGTIYDREGEVLALSSAAKTIIANPRQVKDAGVTAQRLAEVTGGDSKTYLEALNRDSGFAYIERQIETTTALAVDDLRLEGIFTIDDAKRVYPNGNIAGTALGFVDLDGVGKSGLELQYDALLKGTPGEILVERGLGNVPIPGGVTKEVPAVDGEDIVLTLDKDIQAFAQERLSESVERFDAVAGTVVVMDPRDGAIYAIASSEYLDPNDYRNAPDEAFRLLPITDAYEPGSTFKAITAAAVLDRGVYAPTDAFDLPYVIQVYDQRISDSSKRGAVRWTFDQIITHSSNVGCVKLAQGLGERNLYDYVVAFGLTQKPDVDFPGASRGILAPFDQWHGTTYANVSFGQGVSVSALQFARAFSGIMNNGILPTPHFLHEIPGSDSTRTWPTRQVVSPSAAQETVDILINAASDGTAHAVKVSGYTVAGKTGTAQKAGDSGLGYKPGAYVSSFIGALPAEDPQLLVYVVLDEPKRGYYGVQVATPAFNEIAAFAAEHLRIPPSATFVEPEGAQETSGQP